VAHVRIVYDGDCPFCSSYARLARLRQRHDVELVNAREAPGLVRELRDRGVDPDEGMVVLLDGEIHHGDEAAAFLELEARGRLIPSAGWIRRLYPWVFRLRGLALRLLGRDPHIPGQEADRGSA